MPSLEEPLPIATTRFKIDTIKPVATPLTPFAYKM
jgi:hypothetical protein